MSSKNQGFVVPVAIGVLVLASLGLIFYSWFNQKNTMGNTIKTESSKNVSQKTLSDDKSLDSESAAIDSQINNLDNNSADINTSLNDTSSI